MGAVVTEGRYPFNAKCSDKRCGHIWPVAYLPMDLRTFCNVAKSAICPMCGDRSPKVAYGGTAVGITTTQDVEIP